MNPPRFVLSESEMRMCFDLRRRVFIEEQNISPDIEYDEYDIFIPRRHIIMTDDDGNPAGCARLIDLGDGSAKLGRFLVLRSLRGSGAGAFMMSGCIDLIRSAGFHYVEMNAQKRVLGFYQKCGFSAIPGSDNDEAGIPHIRIRAVL